VLLYVFLRKFGSVYLCLMFNYIPIIEFKLQWVAIAEKSGAFG